MCIRADRQGSLALLGSGQKNYGYSQLLRYILGSSLVSASQASQWVDVKQLVRKMASNASGSGMLGCKSSEKLSETQRRVETMK